MAQLTKGMYYHQDQPTDELSHLFGLSHGQITHLSKVVSGARWYNKNGELLGAGDLSTQDFLRIAGEIDEGEFFVVLPERIFMGAEFDPMPEVVTAGILLQNALYAVTRSEIYMVLQNHESESNRRLKGTPISPNLLALRMVSA